VGTPDLLEPTDTILPKWSESPRCPHSGDVLGSENPDIAGRGYYAGPQKIGEEITLGGVGTGAGLSTWFRSSARVGSSGGRNRPVRNRSPES
jgi:hypothetical protein